MISVIMPTYNTDISVLDDAVQSILRQTYSDIEFIIIDDCSKNKTMEYLLSINDPRVKIIRNKTNIGITKSLNVGLNAARGEYIARMDADDIALPERFEKQVKFMQENPHVIVCGTWVQAFGDKHYIQKRVIPNREYLRCSMLFGNQYGLCHPTAMFRASEIRKYTIKYNEELSTAQDYGMWSVCSEYGEIANVSEVLLKYRTHDKQISVAKRDTQIECVKIVQRGLLERLDKSFGTLVDEFHEICNTPWYTKDSAKWTQKILRANKSQGVYNQKELKKYLKDHKFRKIQESFAQVKLPKGFCKLYFNTHISAHVYMFFVLAKKAFKRS